MNIYKIFDNGGKTVDRYTILTETWYNGKSCDAFGMSDDPKSPAGFNQYVGEVYQGAELGKEIEFEKLPDEVQEAIIERLNKNN